MSTQSATNDRLNAELEELETNTLPTAQAAVDAAQGVGDISENTDVRLALEEIARLHARIRQINTVLSTPSVHVDQPSGVVTHGRLVVLQFGGDVLMIRKAGSGFQFG